MYTPNILNKVFWILLVWFRRRLDEQFFTYVYGGNPWIAVLLLCYHSIFFIYFKDGVSILSICYYVSQFTVEIYCFADGRCLFKQPQSVIYHWNQYDEEISKKCRSVRPSVCPFVTLTKKSTPPSLLTVEK